MTKLQIGITFDQSAVNLSQGWWSNGITQNIKFYFDLLEKLGHQPVFLTSSSNQGPSFPVTIKFEEKTYKTLSYSEVVEKHIKLHLIIEAGLSISPHDNELLRETSDANVIGLRCGNPLFMDMEGLFLKHDLPIGLHERVQDVMWLLPQHGKQKQFVEVVHGCPAQVVPYIWEPDFISSIGELPPLPDTPNIMVMEPNVSIVKNALIPMTILESLYLRSPDSFDKAYVLGSENWFNKDYFLNNFVQHLHVLQSETEKVYFCPRYRFPEVMQIKAALLGFQIENELNYLYNEAIYCDLPFVHNARAYEEVGHYYPDYDISAATDQVLKAIAENKQSKTQEKRRQFLFQYSINNPSVQKHYQALLEYAMSF